ncbi:MAG: TolC family protein [Bacteroidales bacterium]|nr:TolC family protein [Bacteroidales bacterium]
MKRICISLGAALLTTTGLWGAEPWSLDQCIDYAIQHNITVKTRQLSQVSAEYDITEAKDKFLPTVGASANESWSFGRGLTSENTYANRNTSNFSWNLYASVPLFQGLSAVRRLDYAKANLRVVVEQLEQAKDDVTLNVISQYLQVLYCREILDVAQEQARLSSVELERRRILLDAGKIPELDLLEAESQLAQDEATVVTSANDHTLALLDLAQLLELDSIDDFDIQPLQDSQMPLLSAEDVYQNALLHNHSILGARHSITAADKNLRLAQTGYFPTLSFSAGLGSSYYTVSGFDNSSFSHQMRDNLTKNIGFSLSIPLFDAFSTRNSMRKAKVQVMTARLDLEQAENTLYKAIQQAYYQAVAAEKKIHSTEAALTASAAAFEAMQTKYNYGKANATEFEQSKTAYIKAMAENVQAKYEHILRLRILEFYNRGTER